MPGAYSKKDIKKVVQPVRTGFETKTIDMDSSNTTETIELSCTASKVTVQSTGDLSFNWSISVTGVDFVSAGSGIAATALSSYSTHLVCAVKIDRVSGSGRVSIAAVS